MNTAIAAPRGVAKKPWPIVVGLLVGVLPAAVIGWLMWWFDHELARNALPGNAPYGTFILFGLWSGVTIGAMYAVVISKRVIVGVIAGVLSAVPLMLADVATAAASERLDLLLSARMWIVQLATVFMPVAAGIMFGLKNLEVNDGSRDR